ncbi:MAG TPA: tRNA (adenosine(37)-N6)-threonylcarbamoyltransferase complex dimerization subunit type 1 TsaB [Rhodocyclaceae bacterium]|nr:tRNA (adenosine(37)-N6)-threonylcarbamoyltransferase complex dimerization subunit type 1 TsaB [Rhodocyclaceae bacterium]
MNLLALETATHHLSVALYRDGEVLERAEKITNGGSERLLPWVGELLAEAGMAFTSLDGIAFGAGPGGFTGLRLACGIAQGLAFGLDLPVLGVSSLEALALAANDTGAERVFACLDARMNEVYGAAYSFCDDEPVTVRAPAVASAELFCAPPGTGWIGCGDGFLAYPDLLGASIVHIVPGLWPHAAAVARLAAPRLACGAGVDAGLAVPLYVRDKVALTTAERLARGGAK